MAISYTKPADELRGSVLAAPVVRPLASGATWEPSPADGDFSPHSLRALARDAGRNARIVAELARGREAGEYHMVLVFACDVAHADALAAASGRAGVPGTALHSRLPPLAQAAALRGFVSGTIDVLVHVGMLTDGFDLPAVDTVVLARPTRSHRLVTQMLGRGARKAPGKDTFVVLDVVDTISRAADAPVRSADRAPRHRPASARAARRRATPCRRPASPGSRTCRSPRTA